MSFYAKKILFNITQSDLDRMTEMRTKHGLQQSEYIRRAIRMYVAEQKLEELRKAGFNHDAPAPAPARHGVQQ